MLDDVAVHCAEVFDRGLEDFEVRDPIVVGRKGSASGLGRGEGLGNMEDAGRDGVFAAGAKRDVGNKVPEPRRGHVVFVVGCLVAHLREEGERMMLRTIRVVGSAAMVATVGALFSRKGLTTS